MSRILILSNGHGEDLSGSLLASTLINQGNKVDALPIVGSGNAYLKKEINIICKTRNFNTGGLGYNSLKGRIDDIFNGQIIYFFKKLLLILFIRDKYDYFVVVGDIVPIFFAWLSKKIFFTYLVAYSSHYEGKLNLPWPCKYFLKSVNSKRIYSRDLLTSYDLTDQFKKEVVFLGNPFMDVFSISNYQSTNSFEIVLLPGSRLNELINNFHLMLDLLETLAIHPYFRNIKFNFALIENLKIEKTQEILELRDWRFLNKLQNSNGIKYSYKSISVNFKWNSFEKILNKCQLVISMAGTAAEQAIGMGKPIIQIEGEGPQFTKIFAEAQRRLLGDYVFCNTQFKTRDEQINGTINLILRIIYLIKIDSNFLSGCKKNALNRIGKPGASRKIIEDIENYFDNGR